MTTIWKFPAGIAALLVVSACSGGPDPESFGGRLQTKGGAVAKIGETWNEGEDAIREGRTLIEDGEDNISSGEKRVGKGRDQVRKGEKPVRDGERMKREAEAAYRLRNGGSTGS